MSFRFRIKNRGIASDNTRGVLNRIDESAGTMPAKIFILLGINDIGNGFTLSESMRNYREILHRIKTQTPSTKIYIQSIFPVDHNKLIHNARNNRRTSEAITLFNKELVNLAHEEGCEFIDTYSIFAVDGEMNDACTFDGLHLNGEGMRRWAEFLEQYL